jgi:hypothetical protein
MTPRRRKGTTLIETMVLGALTSLALTSMSMLTHALLKSSRQLTDASEVRQVAARLQFRIWEDSTSVVSSKMTTQDEVTTWQAVLDGERKLEYSASSRTLYRTIFGKDGQIEHRDQFRLPPTYHFKATGDDARMELRIEQEVTPARREEQKSASTGLRVLALFSHSNKEASP